MSSARTDLCGGRLAMIVPTATSFLFHTRLPVRNLLSACGLRDSLRFAHRRKVIRAGNLLILLRRVFGFFR